ncbi:phage protein [Cupriavidus sp. D384]|uniref:phage protein n=1 Tax=Cupriavidus sp. D384 TaxID=1538095 RepID=UPI000830AD94|nr:hypothetical protein [Cupriavidus sp. D384]
MARFDRTYRLLIGKPGQRGIEILPPLRLTFDIDKDASEQTNQHRLRIYNLRPDTRRGIEVPDVHCTLHAGYVEEGGPLLLAAGAVTDAWTFRDGPDVVTELELRDGYVEVRDTAVSIGYGAGASAHRIVRDIAQQMGLPLVMADGVPDRMWQNGFAYYGPARQALHKVVQGAGLEWSIQNQTLQIVPRRGTSRRQAVVLAADTGLIGAPERTRHGAREKARVRDEQTGKRQQLVSAAQQRDGWRVRSLLLPQINPGDLVKLESRTAEGLFRADAVKHTGDSDDGDWMTELQLVDRAAPPTGNR